MSIPTDWMQELDDLLERAAKLAADRGVDHEVFIQSAWEKCLDARPGLRDQIEDKRWQAELRRLRRRGRIPTA
jgi:hypothetical protein